MGRAICWTVEVRQNMPPDSEGWVDGPAREKAPIFQTLPGKDKNQASSGDVADFGVRRYQEGFQGRGQDAEMTMSSTMATGDSPNCGLAQRRKHPLCRTYVCKAYAETAKSGVQTEHLFAVVV